MWHFCPRSVFDPPWWYTFYTIPRRETREVLIEIYIIYIHKLGIMHHRNCATIHSTQLVATNGRYRTTSAQHLPSVQKVITTLQNICTHPLQAVVCSPILHRGPGRFWPPSLAGSVCWGTYGVPSSVSLTSGVGYLTYL